MGLKVERQHTDKGVHPSQIDKGILCEIVHGGDTFGPSGHGELVYTTDDRDYLYVIHDAGTQEILGDDEIRVRPVPNGTRLVVTDNEGGA